MDKFYVQKGHRGRTSITTLSVRTSSYKVFKKMVKASDATVADLFDAMVNFCVDRMEVVDDAKDKV